MKNIFKRVVVISLMLLILSCTYLFSADKTYGSVRVSAVLRVYDGDTIVVNINEFPPIIGEEIRVRFAEIDAPEITGETESERMKAYEAKVYVTKRLKQSTAMELRNIRRDTYFRILAEVWIFIPEEGWIYLSKELLEKGLAKPYYKRR